ncbi:MAG TPA: ABC transporter ATP-binding protein [Methanospirillum sp.]|nr:ABC transporter ATP-binding protein [Methanospirillum sp.]
MLTITDLGMKFRGENNSIVQAISGVTLTIPDGQFVCILGPSGCGKSTMLRIIAGLQLGYDGIIEHDGSVSGWNTAMVFQEHALFPWLNVEKNVAYGLNLSVRRTKNPGDQKARVQKYLSLCRMDNSGGSFPHQLSGGMCQRVALARALVIEPDVLLMDEPFGALDPQTRTQLQQEVLTIHKTTKKTILLVTHSVEEAVLLADRIILLSGSPAGVRTDISMPHSHPRDPEDPDIIALRKQVTTILTDTPGDGETSDMKKSVLMK